MTAASGRKYYSEFASVAITVAVGTFLCFEIVTTYLPALKPSVVAERGNVGVAYFVLALGISLLCNGIGAVSISGIRLLISFQKADAAVVRSSAKTLLGYAFMVVTGFVLSLFGALLVH